MTSEEVQDREYDLTVYRGADMYTHSFPFNIRVRQIGIPSVLRKCRKRETEGLS